MIQNPNGMIGAAMGNEGPNIADIIRRQRQTQAFNPAMGSQGQPPSMGLGGPPPGGIAQGGNIGGPGNMDITALIQRLRGAGMVQGASGQPPPPGPMGGGPVPGQQPPANPMGGRALYQNVMNAGPGGPNITDAIRFQNQTMGTNMAPGSNPLGGGALYQNIMGAGPGGPNITDAIKGQNQAMGRQPMIGAGGKAPR